MAATHLPMEDGDLAGVANVRELGSREEAEDLLLGRPYGAYVVWRLHKFGVLTYQDPGCKEVAHIVIEKTLAGKYRFRNNAKQEGFETVQELLSSRKYLNRDISIDDINVMAGDGTTAASDGTGAGAGAGAGSAADATKEERRSRMPLRLPPLSAVPRKSEQDEQEKMLQELWPERKPLPSFTEWKWGKLLWWTCVIVAAVGTVVAYIGTVPYLQHHDEAAAEMHSIYTHAQSELENTVGHIGDEFKEWGTDADECREELRGWHDRLAKLEVDIEALFDASSASDALRHTVTGGMAAWVAAALLFIARRPHGKMARHLVLWRVVLVACVVATAMATVVSVQYLHMCSETTQLLHMIPLWLRDVEAVTDECKTALASTKMWLWNTPPHLHLQLPVLSKVPVPATRDVPVVVLVFGSVIVAIAVLGLSVRYQLNKYLVRRTERQRKKTD